MNLKVKERLESGHIVVESAQELEAGRVVIWNGDLAPMDSTNILHAKMYAGVIIERINLNHSIAFTEMFPIDLPDGVYYCDNDGNLTTTLIAGAFPHEIGVVTSGKMKLNTVILTGQSPESRAYNSINCCC